MPHISHEDILSLLRGVVDPERDQDVVTLGMISGIQVREGHVAFAIEVDMARSQEYEALRKRCEEVVFDAPGVLSATAVLTAHSETPGETPREAPHEATKPASAPKAQPGPGAPGGGALGVEGFSEYLETKSIGLPA